MRIMLDTNVLISAFVFGGRAASLLKLLLDSEHCDLLIKGIIKKKV